MRALILGILILVAPGQFAQGAAPSLKVSTVVKSERGSTGYSTAGVANASTLTTSTDLGSGSALGVLGLRMGYDRLQPAYERVIITDRQGNARALSALHPGPENSVRGGLDVTLPALTVSLDGSHTVGNSAYPGHSAALKGAFDRYATGTRYTAELSRSDFSSPSSFFVDPDTFRTRERPGRLLESQVKIGVEQVLSESVRSRLQALYAVRPERAPPKAGFEASLAWAFHDDKAIVTTLGSARERRAGALYSDRGYLDATWLQAELRWEPSYAWRVYGRVGTLLETESARGRIARQRVGTDSLGLELRRTGGPFELGLSSLAAFSNTGYRNLQVGGNFVWLL